MYVLIDISALFEKLTTIVVSGLIFMTVTVDIE